MCYSVEQQEWRVVKWLERYGSQEEYLAALEYYRQTWGTPKEDSQGYHLSGFTHPQLVVINSLKPLRFGRAVWGLIPYWVKDESQAKLVWNKTINARGETLFEKPSFKRAAKNGRCIVIVDSFFEHHHFRKKAFPYRIRFRDGEPILLAGIADVWVNRSTGEEIKSVAIVTTPANQLMAKVHNNPMIPAPRMPLILDDDSADRWLSEISENEIGDLIRPNDHLQLEVYSVQKLLGNNSLGNVPEALDPHEYQEVPLRIE